MGWAEGLEAVEGVWSRSPAPVDRVDCDLKCADVPAAGEFGQGDGGFTEGGAGGGTCLGHTKRGTCEAAGCAWDKKSSPRCADAPACASLTGKQCKNKANKTSCKWKKNAKKCVAKSADGGADCASLERKQCKSNKASCKWKKKSEKCKAKK